MPAITLLSEQDLRAAVALDLNAIQCIEHAFELLATRPVSMPPVLSFRVPEHNGEVDIKTAYVPGIACFAIKVSPGFFDNPKLGLPSLNGLMVLFSCQTGLVEAILLDNGYLTDIRTAAAGGVAAKYLARKDAKIAGIVGSGMQARLQLKALSLVRDLDQAIIWGRNRERVALCAQDMHRLTGLDIKIADDIDMLAAVADIIVTTTPSETPLIEKKHLRAGLHLTAMGSDAEYKTEIAPQILGAIDVLVVDCLAQSQERGELRPAIEQGMISPDKIFPELGEIIAKKKVGRSSETEITLCDLTGTGVQDTAIATFAKERANSNHAGTLFEN